MYIFWLRFSTIAFCYVRCNLHSWTSDLASLAIQFCFGKMISNFVAVDCQLNCSFPNKLISVTPKKRTRKFEVLLLYHFSLLTSNLYLLLPSNLYLLLPSAFCLKQSMSVIITKSWQEPKSGSCSNSAWHSFWLISTTMSVYPVLMAAFGSWAMWAYGISR